ncbi:MAG: T9SS type A sorting domain-containing protein [Spirosomataceae bacterium]
MKTIFYLFLALLFGHGAMAQSIFWTGATDTDWGTGSNWSTNVPPTAADNVFVPGSLARYPVLNGDVSIKSLAVQSGSLLTINAGRTLTISGAGVGYSIDLYGRIENNGTIAVTATSDAVYLQGNAELNNNTGAALSVITTGNYGVKLLNSGVFTNQTGATATITGTSGSLFLSGSNAPTEMVKNYGKITLTGQIEKYTDTFHNYPCGIVNLTSGEVYNNGGQIINEGFFSAPANLNGSASDFINDGIVNVSGSASYTNHKIRIFNNAASTGIFEFGTSNDLTVVGIYKDDAATLSAGDYNQTTNTFTHFGLSAGSQTLYAKITRPGGTCPQIVPFTFVVSVASVFTTHPSNQTVCPGSPASFTVAIANAANYQWQLNTGGGWNNVPATSPYSNETTATLNISNATGLNGYQYRCVAFSTGGASVTSNAATLTTSAGGGSNPTGTLTWTGAVDTDWNTPCNWLPSSVPTATNDVLIPNTTNKPIINTTAVAQSVEVQAGASLTIISTKSLTINGSKSIDSFTSGLFNAGTIHNNGQLVLGNVSSVGEVGLKNTGTFNNNAGAEITIDRATSEGLVNYTRGIFTNAAKITIGANASVGFTGLSNFATFNNNPGGEITINRSSASGLYNSSGGTFTNAAKIFIGTMTPTITLGLDNRSTFINNAGGEITIDNTTAFGLINTRFNPSSPVATFTNAGKITIGATALKNIGLNNADGATFANNPGGEIKIDRSTFRGLKNEGGTFNNASTINIGSSASVGSLGLENNATFNNTGGEIKIDNSTDAGLQNQGGTFTNAAAITIGAIASVGSTGLYNYAVFNNNTGGEIRVDNATWTGVDNEGGTFTNTAKITIGALASVGTFGLTNDGAMNNNACGKLIVAVGIFQNNASGPGTITNTGLVQVAGTLENNGTFTNNGVLKYGSLTGSVTNSTNPSLIVNDTPTPIFTYGGTYDGVIHGIFTDAAATVSAGTFTAPNTFMPSGLPGGTQTLYAKITPTGGSCTYVVPFTYLSCSGLPVSVTGPTSICTGSTTTLSPAAGGIWSSSNPSIATVTNAGIVTGVAEGIVNFTFTGDGCSNTTSNITIKPVPSSNLTASQTDVCPNTQVSLNAHCSIPAATINWNPGAPTVTPDAATLPYVYKASCTVNGCTGNESSVEVRTHRILVDMKTVGPGMLPQPLISAVKDNLAPANTITASPASRRWTFVATGCAASESAAFKLMGPVNFSSIDNGTPYALFANEGSNYYAIDHPNYGNGGSFPNGTYTLTVDLRSQDGVGGPFPKNRVATGALLATRTLQFTVANSAVREGVAEVSEADSEVWAQVSPNPVANTLLLTLNKAKGETVQVHLLDASGRALLQHHFMPKTDQHREVFDLNHITPGMYFLKVNTDRRNTTLKLIKSE